MEIEVGKQYKTRGGWRAVVVDTTMEGFLCWHGNPSTTKFHHKDGSAKVIDGGYDFVEEWQEPEVIEGWVRLYRYPDGILGGWYYPSEEIMREMIESPPFETLAIKRIKFTVGERDDLDG